MQKIHLYKTLNFPLKISLLYFIIGLVWICTNEQLILEFFEGNFHASSLKESLYPFLFVLGSSVFIYLALKKGIRLHHLTASQYRDLVETSHQGLVQTDKHLNITFVNTPLLKMAQLNKEAIIGQNFKTLVNKFFNESERNKILEGLEKRVNKEEGQNEFFFIDHEGNKKWFFVNTVPLIDKKGDFDGILSTVTDITSRKLIEKKLEESQLLYETIFDASNDGIFIYSSKHKVDYVNKAACNMHGMTAEELKSKDPKNFIHPNAYHIFLEFIETVDQGKEYHGEASGLTKTGSIFYVLIYGCPLFINEKKYYFSIIKDVTELKSSRETLREKNEELKKANQELDNFVYRVSHDLRAPIASSIGLAQITKQASDFEEVKKFADLQIESLNKLDNFIKDILNYSMNSRVGIAPEKIDFNKIIDNAIKENEQNINEPPPKIIKNISDSPDFISDNLRMSIILKNIISNAIKYTNPKEATPLIEINIKVNDKNAEITIEDNGMGIDPRFQDKIFDMFVRANEKKEGSGIGLYIVKECLDKINGEIKVDSELGKGTTFYLKILNLNNPNQYHQPDNSLSE